MGSVMVLTRFHDCKEVLIFRLIWLNLSLT